MNQDSLRAKDDTECTERDTAAERWLAAQGFADSRAHSGSAIAKLLSAYSSHSNAELLDKIRNDPANMMFGVPITEVTRRFIGYAELEKRVAELEKGMRNELEVCDAALEGEFVDVLGVMSSVERLRRLLEGKDTQ